MKPKYFVIIYADKERTKLKLLEVEDYNEIWHDLERGEYDKASRKYFNWYEKEADDDDDYANQSSREEQEKEAANYARQLAKKHDLEFVGQSPTDGILD